MPAHDDVCTALRNWRIKSRLRQDAIAKCLGVAQSQVSRWESGRDAPRPHNVDAIRRLIWGPEADPFLSLKHFVTHSQQQLLLLDPNDAILARSVPLQTSPNLLDQFGYVLDPMRNPDFAPAHRRYRALLDHPNGLVGLQVELPFIHEGQNWCASLSATIHSIGGLRACLAEIAFGPSPDAAEGVIRLSETRLTPEGDTNQSIALWHLPIH